MGNVLVELVMKKDNGLPRVCIPALKEEAAKEGYPLTGIEEMKYSDGKKGRDRELLRGMPEGANSLFLLDNRKKEVVCAVYWHIDWQQVGRAIDAKGKDWGVL